MAIAESLRAGTKTEPPAQEDRASADESSQLQARAAKKRDTHSLKSKLRESMPGSVYRLRKSLTYHSNPIASPHAICMPFPNPSKPKTCRAHIARSMSSQLKGGPSAANGPRHQGSWWLCFLGVFTHAAINAATYISSNIHITAGCI